jgi:putative oxidoreductase
VAEDIGANPGTRVDRVGRTGIYPMSGPWPAGNAPIRGQAELGHPEQQSRRRIRARWSGRSAPLAIGRALYGGYFVYNGINHFRQRRMLSEYAKSKQVPRPGAAVLGSGVLALAGGLSLLTGTKPKVGASLISAFLLGVTPRIHDFWTVDDQQQRGQEFINFTKNLALMGGACFAAAVPEPWPASIPARRSGAIVAS